MIEAGATSTSEFQECCPKRCARPTGGSHGRTTRGPAQRAAGAKRRAALGTMGRTGAARGSIEAGARKPRPWRGASILLAALCLPQVRIPASNYVFGEAMRGAPDLEHGVPPDDLRDVLLNVARIDVHEVGIFGRPVER